MQVNLFSTVTIIKSTRYDIFLSERCTQCVDTDQNIIHYETTLCNVMP